MKNKFKFIIFLLFLSIAAPTAYAQDLGYVKETDIVTFIDYSPINSYNYRNNTFVVAENLADYGFEVKWDNTSRALYITRPEKNFTPYISDFVNEKKTAVTYKNLFKVFPTDIKTYINGVLSESYNINGLTVVNVDALGEYGICKYDDSLRRFDVLIIEKEIENCEEKVKTNENYCVTEKGFFENDELVYGIRTNVSATKYGNTTTLTAGDIKNGKTFKANNSYVYMYKTKYEYSNCADYTANITSKDENYPSYSHHFGNKASVYLEEDDRFKYGFYVHYANLENGEEVRYLPKTGEIYLMKEKEDLPYGESVVYDDNGNEIYNYETYPRKFSGTLFKDGYPVYTGDIHFDRFEIEVGSGINKDINRIVALYAPTYSDPDGVIYYYSNSPGNNIGYDSVFYRGNVVNGAAHGNGTLYYLDYGQKSYESSREISVYTEKRDPDKISAVDESIMYVGEFKDGLMDGKGKMYKSGALTTEGTWKSGKKDGFVTEYDAYSDEIYLAFEGNYSNGVKNGAGIEYAAKGNPQFEGVYKCFDGTFENGSIKHGKHYGLTYNAEKNCHEVYLSYED